MTRLAALDQELEKQRQRNVTYIVFRFELLADRQFSRCFPVKGKLVRFVNKHRNSR